MCLKKAYVLIFTGNILSLVFSLIFLTLFIFVFGYCSVTCLSKLRNLTNDSGAGECTELLEAMCRWERASEILQMISDWLKDFLMPTEAPQAVPSKKACMTFHTIFFQVFILSFLFVFIFL